MLAAATEGSTFWSKNSMHDGTVVNSGELEGEQKINFEKLARRLIDFARHELPDGDVILIDQEQAGIVRAYHSLKGDG